MNTPQRLLPLALAAAGTLAACGSGGTGSGLPERPLATAVTACEVDGPNAALGDNYKTLTIYAMGSGQLLPSELNCVLGKLNVTDAVRSHMAATSGLSGMQTDSWDRFHARWTYNGATGLVLIVQQDA